jgi:preprotein translocase subunit SecD
VSATLGEDAKNAGILAGIIGLGLVSIYMILYYRLLGLVALASLALSFMLLWATISYLGANNGLALTLSGVTGIIVSIGVSLDSNIVYFEHMKEDIRNGRTPRSAAERSFAGAFSTVVKADVASLIGAGALYFLTVGSVKGFALYLGLATILDLLATYFFLGPIVQLISRHPSFTDHSSWYGLPGTRRRPDELVAASA